MPKIHGMTLFHDGFKASYKIKANILKYAKFIAVGLISTMMLSGCGPKAPAGEVASDQGEVYEFKFGDAADENSTCIKVLQSLRKE